MSESGSELRETQTETNRINVNKRRGRYLSYLSTPLEEVPRTSKYRLLRDSSFTQEEPLVNDSFADDGLSMQNDENHLPQTCPATETETAEEHFFQDSTLTAKLQEPIHENSELGSNCLQDLSEILETCVDPAIDMSRFEWINVNKKERNDDWIEELEDETEDSEICHEEASSSSSNDPPLYDGASITFAGSLLVIIAFAMRHSLSGVALADLITLINVHLVLPNCFAKSTAVLRNFFRNLKNPIEYHYYCDFCYQYIGLQKPSSCSNKVCQLDFTKRDAPYFIIVPLVAQLQALLGRAGIIDLLSYPTSRMKRKKENIEDVFDGRLYKTHFGEDGFFKNSSKKQKDEEVHLSFQINTDGVALFNSSKFSIWPVYLIINELPPNMRQQRKYRLFAGLWFGNTKPHFQTFLQPLASALNDLFYKGIPISVNNQPKILRCLLLLGTFDAPAKCLFQEFCQFNAFYGCPYCLSPGETVQTSSRGHMHAYPFNESDLLTGHGELRTHKQTVDFAAEAANLTSQDGLPHTVQGVKGLSWFTFIPKFDIIRGVAIDYMHGTLLGVVKMLLALWFDKSYKDEPWSLSTRLKAVEERFMKISPPSCITRLPRSLSDNFSHLKASELRTFLFYSIPCLYGILADSYFQHYILLVEAIYLLLQDSISLQDIQKSSVLLKHFCLRMKELYGGRYETFNVHCLLHLTERVMDLGPLWSHSCFCFEDFNGELRRLFHGTQNIEEQIILAISVQQKIPEILPVLRDGSKEFYNQLTAKRQFCKQGEFINDTTCRAVGKLTSYNFTAVERLVIESVAGPLKEVLQFKRLLLCNQDLIHSKSYKMMTRRNNFTVVYKDEDLGNLSFGEVLFYVKCFPVCPLPSFCNMKCQCKSAKYYALVDVLERKNDITIAVDPHTGATVPHIIPVTKKQSLVAVPVLSIIGLCFHIDCGYGNMSFVGIFPNRFEKD